MGTQSPLLHSPKKGLFPHPKERQREREAVCLTLLLLPKVGMKGEKKRQAAKQLAGCSFPHLRPGTALLISHGLALVTCVLSCLVQDLGQVGCFPLPCLTWTQLHTSLCIASGAV